MNKIKFLVFLGIIVTFAAKAQNNFGIDYFHIKEYAIAKKYFEQQYAQNPTKLNYYLGEISFAQGKTDEAKSYYTKGLAANPEDPFNAIGLAKIELKNNSTAAEASFTSIQKRNPNNIDVKLAIGYAYLDNGLSDKAKDKVSEAQKIDKNNPMVYILAGDIYNAAKNVGEAVRNYEMAIYFDKNFPLSYIKEAEIYEHSINWKEAVDKLNTIIKIHPDYIIAYRTLGRLYATNREYESAIEAFKTYFASGNATLDDITQYVIALYFAKQYDGVNQQIQQGLTLDPSHFVLNRLQFYTATNLNDTVNSIKYAQHFFTLRNGSANDYIAKDYAMYANALKTAQMYDEAIAQYKKAIAIDSNNEELYKDMSTVIASTGQYGYAGDVYKKYIEKAEGKATIADYNQLGKFYYTAGSLRNAADTALLLAWQHNDELLNEIAHSSQQKDSLLKDKYYFLTKAVAYYLHGADSAFAVVVENLPKIYTGYLWRARVNAALDPKSEMGLAKPYYEKVIEIQEGKEPSPTTNSTLIEANGYLGYFYLVKDDRPNARLYYGKVLVLDPKNANATNALNALK